MQIGIVGSGYVGTTLAACFADLGHEVMAVVSDESVARKLNNGNAPISDPDLDGLVDRHAGSAFWATTDYDDLIDFGAEAVFLARPTPSNDDGSIDTTDIEADAESLGAVLADFDGRPTVIVRSAVTPGTTEDVVGPALERASDLRVDEGFDLAVNPGFLREGSAVDDFRHPDKLVFGATTDSAFDTLDAVYDPLLDDVDAPVVRTGRREAEMIQYASDAVLATQAALVAELGDACSAHGVDAADVFEAVDIGDRIDAGFLQQGAETGRRYVPNDVTAAGQNSPLLRAAIDVTDAEPQRILDLLDSHLDVEGERVAVLGLASEPDTDAVRNSPAIPVLEGLQERGADIVAYDPNTAATDKIRAHFPDVECLASPSPTLSGARVALVLTDWPKFGELDREFDLMSGSLVIDARRVVERRDGIDYDGLVR